LSSFESSENGQIIFLFLFVMSQDMNETNWMQSSLVPEDSENAGGVAALLVVQQTKKASVWL
jgi:hypothetical protein